jgi:alpha-ketoglutarate-dependent taurine dioxygenase
MQGGRSLLVSAVAVHDMIAEESPELLQELYRPFVQDRRGEEAQGEHSWFTMPIFELIDGRFVSRYIRRFIESASRFPDAPRLTQEQLAALEAIDRVLSYPGVALELDFRPGDLQLLNNATIWHSRTSYQDSADPTQKRLLIRLWISPPNSRKLGNSFLTLYGDVRAGAVRGGIRPRS